MKILNLMAICICLVGAAVLPAQAQKPVSRDSQALALLIQSLAINGGPASWLQDTVAEGSIAWPDGTVGTIRLKTKGLDRLRSEVTIAGSQTISVTRAGSGNTNKDGQRQDLPPWVTAYQRPIHLPALSRLADIANPQMNVLYVGLEEVNGLPAHHIRLFASPTDETPAEIEEMISDFHLFLDSQTLLIVKTLSYDFSPEIIENRTLVATYFADFRPVGGLVIPHRIERYIYDEKHLEINLTAVQFNVGLPDSEFQ